MFGWIRKSTSVLALVAAAALLLSAVATFRWRDADRRARSADRRTAFVLDSLGKAVVFSWWPLGPAGRDTVYWKQIATMAELSARSWARRARDLERQRTTLLNDAQIRQLGEKGLKDPIHQLRDSLEAHPELIPFEGIMGSSMVFLTEPIVLEPPYVFAYFEDGHIGGHMLLEYKVEGDRIRWKRLWARLD